MKAKIRTYILLLLALGFILQGGGPTLAGQETAIPRKILAIYDSRDDKTLAYNELHSSIQMVLEYQGCMVKYWDISGKKPLPGSDEMADYRGVITQLWRTDAPRAAEYISWMLKQLEAGRKLVLMESMWPLTDTLTKKPVPEALLNKYRQRLGLEGDDSFTENPALLEYTFQNKRVTDFERKLPLYPPLHASFHATRRPAEPIIMVRRKGKAQSEFPAAALTNFGGVLTTPYYLYHNPNTALKQWYIDPFYFFEKAFNTRDLPKPDVSTVSGRRTWYNHLDGDALLSLSRIQKGKYCGEVLRDHLFKKYDLPFTVSVIVCEVDPGALGREEVVELARSIFALKNVEPASHTFSHPFDWASAVASGNGKQIAADKNKLPYGHFIKVPGYKFSLEKEVVYGAEYINQHLVPPGKRCEMILWSGNCKPPAEAIALAENNHMGQINGGDTIFDRLNPSLTGVAPLMLQVGDELQVYTSMANENIYTNLWTGPFWGQRRVVQTFERTGKPRRLRPINLYFHFYAGERQAALNALIHAIKWGESVPTSPVYASHYYRMVQGFIKTRYSSLPEGGYKVSHYGLNRTIRFDHTSKKVDFQRSKNVQGFNYHGGSLYLHLGPNEASIYLTDQAPALPYLAEASGLLDGWQAEPGRVSFTYRGWGQGPVVLAGLPKGAEPRISGQGWQAAGPVGGQGKMSLKGPAGVRVTVSW